MHLNQLIILNCESRKELDNIQHPSLNVPAGQFLFCYPRHCQGLHPGGVIG